jgi:hypothetical protein
MTTTITTDSGQVPLPPGASFGDDWAGGDEPYRVIFGVDRTITDTAVCVYSAVVQLADGSIDQGTVAGPSVNISNNRTDGPQLNVDQARELAQALLAAADEIDGWVTR